MTPGKPLRRVALRMISHAEFFAWMIALVAVFAVLAGGCVERPQPGPVRAPVAALDPTTAALDATVRVDVLMGGGSGIAWDARTIVTAKHVVDDDPPFVMVTTRAGQRCTIDEVMLAAGEDVAVIRVHGCTLHPLVQARSAPSAGATVWAAGHPFGQRWSLCRGVVSAIRGARLQTDAAVNPGMSGGPIVDSRGQLVGMTVALTSTSGMFGGIGWALTVETLRDETAGLLL